MDKTNKHSAIRQHYNLLVNVTLFIHLTVLMAKVRAEETIAGIMLP